MNTGIILAGGQGDRFGGEVPKQFVVLHGRRVLDYGVETFESHPDIQKVIIVVPENWLGEIEHEYPQHEVVLGGNTRRASSYAGPRVCPPQTKKVLLHDAARPFVDHDMISRVLNALDDHLAVDTAINATDTIIEVHDGVITDMPIRDNLFLGQTPQGFDYETILKAHETIEVLTTDDVRLVKEMGIECISVAGSEYNLKITSSHDLYMAERVTQTLAPKKGNLADPSGKRALILGGTGGIGTAINEHLILAGAEVRAYGSEIDLAAESLPEDLNRHWDIIIHAAGVFIRKPFRELSIEEWNDVMSVNLRSAFLVGKLAQTTMKEQGWLIFIGSSSSHRGRTSQSVYAASKAALNNLTQSLAEEYLELGIRVNCVNPPRTDTPMRHKAFPNEDRSMLADPLNVAQDIIRYCSGDETGHIVNLRYASQFRTKR